MNQAQLRKFWAVMGDLSEQVDWPVNGELTRLDREDWRLIICAAYKQEQRIAEGLNGGHVVLGLRLRDLFKGLDDETKQREISGLIELATAFGSERGVMWSDPEFQSLVKEADRA